MISSPSEDVRSSSIGTKRKRIDVSGSSSSSANLHVSTMNVKYLCGVLSGLCNIPNADLIMIQFTPTGMLLYSKPDASPVVVASFWNTQMFQNYQCDTTTHKWVSKTRLEHVRKKISKDVDLLHISTVHEPYPGLSFFGTRSGKSGRDSKFSFTLLEKINEASHIDTTQITYNWHIQTSSQLLKDSIDLIDDSSDYVSMEIESNSLKFKGIADSGIVSETTSHTVDTPPLTVTFKSLFSKRYLKTVTSTYILHKSILISFNPDNKEDDVYPVSFSYTLDHEQPRSHFTAFIMPAIE
jgi:hypothetical protein